MNSRATFNTAIAEALDDRQQYIEKLVEILLKMKEIRILMGKVIDPMPKDAIHDDFLTSLNDQLEESIDALSDEQGAIVQTISNLCYDSMITALYPS